MHVIVIFILCMMSVGSMCDPHFRREVVRDKEKRSLGLIDEIRGTIRDRVDNRIQSVRERARDAVARIDPGSDGGFLTKFLQPLLDIKDSVINEIKTLAQSVLADSIKDVINDFIPENLFLYLGLGLGIIAVSFACCLGCCCAGYFTMLKELKKISGNMTDQAGRLPSKDTMYVNCLDY